MKKSSKTSEEPSKRQPMTVSYRKKKTDKYMEEEQHKHAKRKSEAKKCLARLTNDDSDDIIEDAPNDDKGEHVVEESYGEEGDKEEGGDDDTGEENGSEDDSGEGVDNEEDRDEKSQEDIQEVGDEDDFLGFEDDFLGFEDDESDHNLYEKHINHVAYHLRKNIDRGPLTCKQTTGKLWTWDVLDESKDVQIIVQGSSLYRLYSGSFRTANRVLVSAFVERWHPETNTFHMPFGEVTITLDDVEELLEIPVTGKPMLEIKLDDVGPVHVWISGLLGIPAKEVLAEMNLCGGNVLRTGWIIDCLSSRSKSKYKAQPEQIARGYMLVMLGCTLFQDRSGDKVMARYLYYLQDMKDFEKWAWGAGTLAFLYRMLNKASISNCTGVGGYLTLLEAWIYERFPKQRPGDPAEITDEQIKTQKWNPSFKMSKRAAKKYLKYVRGELDNVTAKDFVWTPYRALDEDPSEVAWFYGCLMLHDIVEPYHPNRVVRQFGRVQNKPKSPIRPKSANRKKVKAYEAKYDHNIKDFEDYTCHLVPENARGPRAKQSGQCTTEYEKWYKSTAIIQLNHEVSSSVFTIDEHGEGRFTTKAIGVAEEYVKKGLKATKQELLNALKDVVNILKEGGGCVGINEVETGEPTSSGKKKSKSLVEKNGSKAKEKGKSGKRKTNDVMVSGKKKPKTVLELDKNTERFGASIGEPSCIRKEKSKDATKGKTVVEEKHRKLKKKQG